MDSKQIAEIDFRAATLVSTAARLRNAAKVLAAADAAERLLDRVRQIPPADRKLVAASAPAMPSPARVEVRQTPLRGTAVFDATTSSLRKRANNNGGHDDCPF